MKFTPALCLLATASAFELTLDSFDVDLGECLPGVVTCYSGSPSTPPASPAAADAADYIPTVFMHGLGDSGSNRGMKNIAKSVSSRYPGAYSVAVDVANGMSSYTHTLESQVEDFAAAVLADGNLSRGFNAVGLSQGGLIVRAYVQKHGDDASYPAVHNLVSLCGPQGGVGDCPGGTPKSLCSVGKSFMYGAGLSFSGYWKDTSGDADKAKATYLEKSPYLADLNNDKDEKNDVYVKNLQAVNKCVWAGEASEKKSPKEPSVAEAGKRGTKGGG